jgi:hypothetical protein
MRAAKRPVKRDSQRDLEVFAPLSHLTRGLDRRLEELPETLAPSATCGEVKALESKRRLLAQCLPLDHTSIVSAPAFRIGKNLERLSHQREHRSRFRAARMKIRMKLAGPTLIGTTQFRRRKLPVDSKDRVEIRHDLSVPLSILHAI